MTNQPKLDMQIPGDETAASPEQDAIRAEYTRRLAEKLKDPEFRKIEGFPIGTDEAILALSDPPYYTACPNPFLDEWLAENAKPFDPETDDYHREPFAADVSEGKNDPIYNAHSYHTKVPHKAIMRYILHYTEPGDVVYDGFCGTGMTGVAAQMCGNKAQVESLGYTVKPDGAILNEDGEPFSKLGARKCILNDLSPAATFIAYNYNHPVDPVAFEREAKRVLAEVEAECGWMYETKHTDGSTGRINYTVWSDVFHCSNCSNEVVFWDAAVDKDAGKVLDEFPCPHCGAALTKRNMERKFQTLYDKAIGETIRQAVQVPVLINYSVGKKRFEKVPDEFDLALIRRIEEMDIPHWFPTDRMPEGDESRRNDDIGLTHVHHFYTKRSLRTLSTLLKLTAAEPAEVRHYMIYFADQAVQGFARICRYVPTHYSQVNQFLSGTLYIGSQVAEVAPAYLLDGKLGRLAKVLASYRAVSQGVVCHCASATDVSTSPSTVDYVFTDPPFGANLMYSELNFLWESWLKVFTNNKPEAIQNKVQGKGLPEYQELMTRCFQRYYEALKPGRWMTVEFHNSSDAVWNSIQEALARAQFVVADVRVLDRQQGTFKQVTSTAAVGKDLIISCYKPHGEFEERFQQLQGKPEAVVEFLRQHLAMLPVTPTTPEGQLQNMPERMRFLLFDRMVAYHLMRGARVPLSSADFYALLDREFVERDEMYFLPDQAARYDAVRVRTEVEQQSLFVNDERTAVQWVRARLLQEPQTQGALTPKFMQELQAIESYENMPELKDILKENFIQDTDGRWRVPDPQKEKDIEDLRRRGLLKLFDGYVRETGQLKTFRKEAVLEGFRHCWDTKQYAVIVAVCERIPVKTLQEIHEFVQFYDIAKDIAPEAPAQLEFTWE